MSYSSNTSGQLLRSASVDIITESESSNESSSLAGSSSDERLDVYYRPNGFHQRNFQYVGSDRENVTVNGDNTIINLNSMLQISVVGPSFTQVVNPGPTPYNSAAPTPSYTPSQAPYRQDSRRAATPPKEVVMPLYHSDRIINDKDVLIVSKNLGPGWRDVGTRLLFRPKQLDTFQQESSSQQKLGEKMLFRWREWKDTRATVGRLTKCLFLAEEFDAVVALSP